jgi:hypothetical protein
LGAVGFGSQILTPPPAVQNWTINTPYDVDGNPITTADNILVRVEAQLDDNPFSSTYGLVTWTFSSLESAPPHAPVILPNVGFLPANVTAPEGQGFVSFQITPLGNLPSGHTLENQASIIFDLNPAILTGNWVNTIDLDPPASQVNALPPTVNTSSFTVNWSGTDADSGLASFDVFVSDDFGPFVAWQTGTTQTGAIFTGQAGHHYRFYSVAVDQVGHREDDPSLPDAETSVSEPLLSYSILIPAGGTLLVNQLNRGGNTLNEVLPNVPIETQVLKWDCALQEFGEMALFDGSQWVTPAGEPSAMTLLPGQGAWISGTQGEAVELTMTGTLPIPLLPSPSDCGCGKTNLLGRQIPELGTFESIIGSSPVDGAQVMRFGLNQQFETYTYQQGAWSPSIPILQLGEAARFYMPCVTNTCVELTLSGESNQTVECGQSWEFIVPQAHSACCNEAASVAVVGTVTNGTCPKSITRMWVATNSCGGRAEFNQTVTIRDSVPPVLSLPPDQTVTAPSEESMAWVDFTASAQDLCDPNVPVTLDVPPGYFAVGTTVVTGEAIDACGNRATGSFSVTVLPAPEQPAACCTFTQGYYGNPNGKFNAQPSWMVVSNLLAEGPLTVGKAGGRSLTVRPGDGALLQGRLPSGGTPTALPDQGEQELANGVVSLNRKGRFDNVLLGQTLTLSLNVRLNPRLLRVGLAPGFCTRRVLPGPDGRRGTLDDEPVTTEDALSFAVPAAVRAAVVSPVLGINDPTVRGLLELANRALGGQAVGSATWSEINDAVDAINRGFDECRVLVDCATGALIDSANDRFENRPSLNTAGDDDGNVRVRTTNRHASRENGEPEIASEAAGKSLWWRWSCPRSGPVLLTTSGSSIDTLLAVYTGAGLPELQLVQSNDDPPGDLPLGLPTSLQAEVRFEGIAGQEYQIAIEGHGPNWGTIVVSLILDRPILCPPVLGAEGEVTLCVEGPRGRLYTVEASTDLEHWTPIGTVRNVSGVLTLRDAGRGGAPYRFYRAVIEL